MKGLSKTRMRGVASVASHLASYVPFPPSFLLIGVAATRAAILLPRAFRAEWLVAVILLAVTHPLAKPVVVAKEHEGDTSFKNTYNAWPRFLGVLRSPESELDNF